MRLVEFLNISRGEPKGTFVGVHFTQGSVGNLVKWMQEVGLENPVDPRDLHVTLLYDDDKGFAWQNQEYSPPLELDPETFRLDVLGGALVLRFENEILSARHDWGIEHFDINWEFPDFKSHTTLSYKPSQSPCDIPVPHFPLYLSHEYASLAGADGPNVQTVGEPRV